MVYCLFSYTATAATRLHDKYMIIAWFLAFYDFIYVMIITAMMILWPHYDKSLHIRVIDHSENKTIEKEKQPNEDSEIDSKSASDSKSKSHEIQMWQVFGMYHIHNITYFICSQICYI